MLCVNDFELSTDRTSVEGFEAALSTTHPSAMAASMPIHLDSFFRIIFMISSFFFVLVAQVYNSHNKIFSSSLQVAYERAILTLSGSTYTGLSQHDDHETDAVQRQVSEGDTHSNSMAIAAETEVEVGGPRLFLRVLKLCAAKWTHQKSGGGGGGSSTAHSQKSKSSQRRSKEPSAASSTTSSLPTREGTRDFEATEILQHNNRLENPESECARGFGDHMYVLILSLFYLFSYRRCRCRARFSCCR